MHDLNWIKKEARGLKVFGSNTLVEDTSFSRVIVFS